MNTENHLPPIAIYIHEEHAQLTLADLCHACEVHAEIIIELVNFGVLEPKGRDPGRWIFKGTSLHRARAALRLQHDLEMNLAGTALAMELLDEITSLKSRLHALGGSH